MYTVSIWHPKKTYETVWNHFGCLALPNCFVTHPIKRKSKWNEALFIRISWLLHLVAAFFRTQPIAQPVCVSSENKFSIQEMCANTHTHVYTADTFIECNENRSSSSSTYVHSFCWCCCCRAVIFSIIPMLQMQSAGWVSELSATAFHSVSSEHTLVEHFCHSHMRALCIQSNLLCVLSLSLSTLLSLIWFDSWLFLFLSLLSGAALCFATGSLRVRVFVAEKAVLLRYTFN